MKKVIRFSLLAVFFAIMTTACGRVNDQTEITPDVYEAGARARYCGKDTCLILEFLEDDLLHVEYAAEGAEHDLSQPVWTSPMVQRIEQPGPSVFKATSNSGFQTASLRVEVNQGPMHHGHRPGQAAQVAVHAYLPGGYGGLPQTPLH